MFDGDETRVLGHQVVGEPQFDNRLANGIVCDTFREAGSQEFDLSLCEESVDTGV